MVRYRPVYVPANNRDYYYNSLYALEFLRIYHFQRILLYFYNSISFEEIENHRSHFAVISAHAVFLFLLLLVREMIKDLENLKGDLANNYKKECHNLIELKKIYAEDEKR